MKMKPSRHFVLPTIPTLAVGALLALSIDGFTVPSQLVPRADNCRERTGGYRAATPRVGPRPRSPSSSSLSAERERGFTSADDVDRAVITMPIDEDVSSRDVVYSLERNVLTLGVKGVPAEVDGEELWGPVIADDSYWEIDDVPGQGRCVLLELTKRGTGKWEYLLKSQYVPPDATVTERAYLDVEIDGTDAGRIEVGLYGNQVPRTVDNFLGLCKGDKESDDGVRLAYEGSAFHRIIPGFMLQGGDFTNGDGTGGVSIFGAKFDDEDFGIKHDRPGLLSMANAGPNTNGSQFFVTVAATPWLDGKHVVFGEVTGGMEVVTAVEAVGDESGAPSKTVRIKACGVL